MKSNVFKTLQILEGASKVTIEKSQGEYRVPAADGYEDGAHYTDDKEDAISVAKKVFGDEIVITYRSVPEFVGGKYEKYRPKGKLKEAKQPDLGKCPECGKPLSKGIKKEWDGYKKCDNMNCKKYNVGIPLKEELDEAVDRGLVKAYEEGKKAGKNNDSRASDNPYKSKRNMDAPDPRAYEKAWREGWEDGAYPSEARKNISYLEK